MKYLCLRPASALVGLRQTLGARSLRRGGVGDARRRTPALAVGVRRGGILRWHTAVVVVAAEAAASSTGEALVELLA